MEPCGKAQAAGVGLYVCWWGAASLTLSLYPTPLSVIPINPGIENTDFVTYETYGICT